MMSSKDQPRDQNKHQQVEMEEFHFYGVAVQQQSTSDFPSGVRVRTWWRRGGVEVRR